MSNYTPVFSSSISFHTAVIMPLTYVLLFISIPILSPVLKYCRAAAYSLSCWFLMNKEINFFSVFTAQGLCLSWKQYRVCVQIRPKSNLVQQRGKEKRNRPLSCKTSPICRVGGKLSGASWSPSLSQLLITPPHDCRAFTFMQHQQSTIQHSSVKAQEQ